MGYPCLQPTIQRSDSSVRTVIMPHIVRSCSSATFCTCTTRTRSSTCARCVGPNWNTRPATRNTCIVTWARPRRAAPCATKSFTVGPSPSFPLLLPHPQVKLISTAGTMRSMILLMSVIDRTRDREIVILFSSYLWWCSHNFCLLCSLGFPQRAHEGACSCHARLPSVQPVVPH